MPLINTPELRNVEAEINFRLAPQGPSVLAYNWSLNAKVYFLAGQAGSAIFPDRKTRIALRAGIDGDPWPVERSGTSQDSPQTQRMAQAPKGVRTIVDGIDQLIVNGPGYAWVWARGSMDDKEVTAVDQITLEVHMEGVDLPRSISVSAVLHAARAGQGLTAKGAYDEDGLDPEF